MFEQESARQRAGRTELQRTLSDLFCVESRVSIAFSLLHLITIVGDYFEHWVYQLFSIGHHLSIQHQQKLKWQQ